MLVLSTVANLITPEDGESCRGTSVKNREESALQVVKT